MASVAAFCSIYVRRPLTAELSHLPPLDLRFRGLAGTAGAAGVLFQQLDVCLLAGWREKVREGVKERIKRHKTRSVMVIKDEMKRGGFGEQMKG